MDQDTVDYFNHQAAVAQAKFERALARSHANGTFARVQWMRAASDAARDGAQFSERATRKLHQRWDTYPTYRLAR